MNDQDSRILRNFDSHSTDSITSLLEYISDRKEIQLDEKMAFCKALTVVFYHAHHVESTCMPKLAISISKHLAKFGPEIIPYLFEEMIEADSESATYFGKTISKNKIEGLNYTLSKMDHCNEHQLLNCIQSLSYYKIPEARMAILPILHHCNNQNKHVAAMSLYVTGRLIQKLKVKKFSSSDLSKIYKSVYSCLSSQYPLIRKNAARTLGKMFKLGILSTKQGNELHQAFLAITGDNHEHNWDRSYIVRREAEDFLPLFKKPAASEYSQSFKVISKHCLCSNTFHYELEAPLIARKIQAGQFIIVRPHLHSERIPLSICGWDRQKGTISIIVSGIGRTTKEMNLLQVGDCYVDVVGPLGNRSHLPTTSGTCVVVGGGYGVGAIIPTAIDLKEQGNEVIAIVGARDKKNLIMLYELNRICDEVITTTADGTHGIKGLVTDALRDVMRQKPVVHVLAIGPVPMMKAVSEMTLLEEIPTYVSLNAIMVDGTGMCGACRVSVDNKTKFACFHGPDFDGHLVDFDNLMKRQKMFIKEEKAAVLAMNEDG